MSLKDHFREAKDTLSISMLHTMKWRGAFFWQNNDIFLAALYVDTAFYYRLKKNKGVVRLFLNFSAVDFPCSLLSQLRFSFQNRVFVYLPICDNLSVLRPTWQDHPTHPSFSQL